MEFYWQTQQQVRIDGRQVILTGKRGQVSLLVPEGCSIRVDELPLMGGEIQQRIAICKPDRSGTLRITASLSYR